MGPAAKLAERPHGPDPGLPFPRTVALLALPALGFPGCCYDLRVELELELTWSYPCLTRSRDIPMVRGLSMAGSGGPFEGVPSRKGKRSRVGSEEEEEMPCLRPSLLVGIVKENTLTKAPLASRHRDLERRRRQLGGQWSHEALKAGRGTGAESPLNARAPSLNNGRLGNVGNGARAGGDPCLGKLWGGSAASAARGRHRPRTSHSRLTHMGKLQSTKKPLFPPTYLLPPDLLLSYKHPFFLGITGR